LSDGFFVGNDWIGLDDFNVGEFPDQIVETDFDVQFSAPGDNVFSSGFFGGTLD
jgi:hypothetical protein